MKSGLIAAVVVGTAIAAIILYYQKRLTREREVLIAGHDDFHSIGSEVDNIITPAQHAMG